MDRYNRARDLAFGRLQETYGRLLAAALQRRGFVLLVVGLLLVQAFVLAQVVGTDFFPQVDAGLMRMHVRAPLGTRIEDTEQVLAAIEHEIRQIIPQEELKSITDNIGLPVSYNLAFIATDSLGGQDADLLVALAAKHAPTVQYRQAIRRMMDEKFPGVTLYFQPADIMSQVLNFGLSAPIDVRVEGMDLEQSAQTARALRDAIKRIPGAVDVRIVQGMAHPGVALNIDREYAAQLGLTQRDVADSMITSLSSSALVSPSFWLNPQNSVNYVVAVQTPLAQMGSLEALMATPISGSQQAGMGATTPFASAGDAATYLGSIAHLRPTQTRSLISHNRVQRVVNVQCGVEGRDLGGVARDIQAAIEALPEQPVGSQILVAGQSESMNSSFASLGLGLVLASLLVYLLMVVLFQSWLDPFIIMMAVPGALIGVVTLLALTGTTINVESLMGTIMAVGVAVSNSILLVSFANELRETDQLSALDAALEAGKTRLRPVLMTALAMVLGMLPMALALGEGGEQNAPLGRAVIGGLLVATGMTLLVVPVVYSLVRRAMPNLGQLDAHFQQEMQARS
jgi:multidrug efflux pump subunit AcrB